MIGAVNVGGYHFLTISARRIRTGNISNLPNHISKMSVSFSTHGINGEVMPTVSPTLPSALATSNKEFTRLCPYGHENHCS